MIIPPYDTEQWIEALQRLAASADLRAQFSISARQRAEEFTWDQVANRRAALMVEKLRGQ
jgi:glycosyltransferase involved in cell wall biosynthesis